jgi:2-methylcitrate dehydratase PrpD
VTAAPQRAVEPVADDAPLAVQLAAFASDFSLERLPPAAAERLTERVRWHVLDAVGLALSSWTAPDRYAQKLLGALEPDVGSGRCTIFGHPRQASPSAAAMANGSLAHGSDFDDVDLRTVMHCEAYATAALVAIAEHEALSGRELADAWVVAVETALRLASGANGSGGLFSAGFHNTAVFGTLGAAAGVSRLLGLSADETANALALAVSFASGTSVGWLHGSGRNKPLQAGWAAKSGLLAASLARTGYTCSLRTLDGPRGLFDAHAWQDGWSVEPILDGLGSEWRTLGLSIKLYPCGAMIQATAECVDVLVTEHGITAGEVVAGEIVVPEQFWPVIEDMGASLYRPPSGFTMIGAYPCIAATIVLDGHYGLEHLADEAASDPAMLALADRFELTPDRAPESRALPLDERPATVTIETARGTFRHTVGVEAGHAQRLDRDRVVEKFRRNAGLVLDGAQVGEIESAALAVDELAAVGELTALLRPRR